MLRYKNVTLNPKNIDRCFQYAFTLTKHHEEIKNHPKRVSNIRQFLDLFNWTGIEYPTSVYKINYTLFEKRNQPEITLIVLYIDVDLVIAKFGQEQHAITHKSIIRILPSLWKRKKGCFVNNSPMLYRWKKKYVKKSMWK